jgi:hypothetical protein
MPQTPAPMVPNNALVTAVNKALADASFRDAVRQMHAQGYPLTKMVDDLGLEEDMTARIREILETLSPEVVDEIRSATLEMLDSKNYVMPLDCTVTDAQLDDGTPVQVEVDVEKDVKTIHVRPASSS